MGKRIELTEVYRPKRKPTVIAKLKAKVEDFERPARELHEPSPPIAVEPHRIALMPPVSLAPGSVNRVFTSDASEELARRRAIKAAAQRRYRAKQKAKA